MSNNFLQRFKGKTQIIGKEGVKNVLGGKDEETIVYTNNNNQPKNNTKYNTTNSLKKNENNINQKVTKGSFKGSKDGSKGYQKNNNPHQNHSIEKVGKLVQYKPTVLDKKQQNPFVISNPFYLDEEEKQKQEKKKKQNEKIRKIEEELSRKQEIDEKKNTHMSYKSMEKKNDKEWVKLGGLGANIGGDQWLQKKKKQDKMQEFAGQVKSINSEKGRPPKSNNKKSQKKQLNNRQKALQYSKNIPKPTINRQSLSEQISQEISTQIPFENELTELQQYQLKHEKLKNMLKNQI